MASNQISFTKMHGLGNDFVVVNALTQPFKPSSALITQLADRHTGIGFDQLLIITATPDADFFCHIYNADGSEASQCGNGLRCIARYVHEENLTPHTSFNIATRAGKFAVTIHDYNHIQVTLGEPILLTNPSDLSITVVSTGNPHAILKVENLDAEFSHATAANINGYFQDGINIGFMQILSHQHARLRTIERGAGETLACGSNACAAAVAGIHHGWLTSPTTIEYGLGKLIIEWAGKEKPVYLTGPATRVFSGVLT